MKALNPKKESGTKSLRNFWGDQYRKPTVWKDNFSATANSVGSTDNRDQVMNALGTVLVWRTCGVGWRHC